MADEHKSSEDRIREANRKLRESQDLPEPVTPPASRASEEGNGEPLTPKTSVESQAPTVLDESPKQEASVRFRPDEGLLTHSQADSATRQPARGSRFAALAVRFGIGIAVFAGIGLFSSFNDAGRDDSGELVRGGDLDVMALQVGDCFDDPEEIDEIVFDVAAVPCAEPHDNEVYSVLPISGVFGIGFPGDDVLLEYSYDVCAGESFRSYVGTDYFDSSLDMFTFTPTEESWGQGDREVVCVLYRLDFTKLTGTARNSGL